MLVEYLLNILQVARIIALGLVNWQAWRRALHGGICLFFSRSYRVSHGKLCKCCIPLIEDM